MLGLNLHEIAGSALTMVNPWKEMTFEKSETKWVEGSRKPEVVKSTVTVQGKLQPASLQQLAEMGFALNEYQYFRVFLSLDATQLDRIRQLGSDRFICEGNQYRIVAKEDWLDNNGWREAYCYLEKINVGE